MPDINGIPYVESTDLVSAYPAASQALAQEVSDQLASKLPYSYGTATPSTTDSGFLWYDSNSTPAVAKYWDGSAFATLAPAPGMELVADETVTAANTISVNGCFTSTYDNYLIVAYATFTTASGLLLRLRSSGSDDTGNNYSRNGYQSTSSLTNLNADIDAINLDGGSNRLNSAGVLTLMRPQKNAVTGYIAAGASWDATSGRVSISAQGHNITTTQFDGFTMFAAQNFTGVVRAYGMKN